MQRNPVQQYSQYMCIGLAGAANKDGGQRALEDFSHTKISAVHSISYSTIVTLLKPLAQLSSAKKMSFKKLPIIMEFHSGCLRLILQ